MDYNLAVYIIYGLLTLFALINSFFMDLLQKQFVEEGFWVVVLSAFAFILLFGFRDIKVGPDTLNYTALYQSFEKANFQTDFLIDYLIIFLNLISPEPTIFFVLMAIGFIVPLIIALRKISEVYEANFMLVFFSFVSFFFFYTLGINIIRQGVSLSFLMLGFINFNLYTGNKKKWIIPFIIALGFHLTSIIPIVIFLFVIWAKRFKIIYFYIIFVCAILIARMNLGVLALEGIISEILVGNRRMTYLTNESIIYEVGFKPTFVVFNTLFLIVFTIIYNAFEQTKMYRFLLIYYILTSALFFMTFQMPYSDRWGVISWITIPFLLSPIFSLRYSHRVATVGVLFLVVVFFIFKLFL